MNKKKATLLIVLAMWLTSPLAAQTTAYSLTVFGPTATDPATATPIAPTMVYPIAAVPCNQPKLPESAPPIVNPNEVRFDDPAKPVTADCVITVDTQMRALPVGTGYAAAMRAIAGTTPSAWSPLSTPFAVSAVQAHPCDGNPPTSSTVLEGTRTLSWCHNDLDAKGNPTTVTSWEAYVDGVKAVLTGVTAGTTVNSLGLRLYSAPLALVKGTHLVEIVGVNAVGAANKSVQFSVIVTVAPAVPSVSVIRGVQ